MRRVMALLAAVVVLAGCGQGTEYPWCGNAKAVRPCVGEDGGRGTGRWVIRQVGGTDSAATLISERYDVVGRRLITVKVG